MIESGMTESQSISLVSNGCSHLNGIGSFRAFAKTGLVHFLEMLKHTFYFHLKEWEFWFILQKVNIRKLVLKMPREQSLCWS